MSGRNTTMLSIRKATLKDCDSIAKFMKTIPEYAVIDKQTLISRLKENISEGHIFSCLVAEEEGYLPWMCPLVWCHMKSAPGRMAGYAMYCHVFSTKEGNQLQLDSIYVAPEYRKQGVDSALMQQVFHEGKTLGCRRIRCNVLQQNQDLISLLQKHQFLEQDTQQGFDIYHCNQETMRRIVYGSW
ncbi:thialysine N-epsilon-acetyltransferase-like isoform X2 [Ornithodoros turicata]|uniref:thialysine N-epsilon-acetyltransferase-like isoform X2 n=1 Tax=Ornithodoros turicata TaxID=34597 RepID=UPI0031388220